MARSRHVPAFLVTFGVFAGGLLAGHQAVLAAHAAGGSPYEKLDVFARAMTQIQTHYVEERSTGELVEAAIKGMTEALDAHSGYYDAETYASFLEDTEGATTGIGVLVTIASEGGLAVDEVIPGGPADLAGIQAGDRLVSVDDEDITLLTIEEAVSRVKGERGTEVVLGLVRDGTPLRIAVVRDEVLTPSVHPELVEPGLGYVRIDEFRRRSGGDFLAAMESLGPLDGLVLDLRSNPGGLMDEAVVVVDHFVDQGLIVETRGRGGKATDERREAAPDADLETRLVVLVNGTSASASEIVAGALQAHERAQVVGRPTYGKGSVQSYFEHEDKSALKLTIARYYLPDGRHLERGAGVFPDHDVSLYEAADALAELEQSLREAELGDDDRAELMALAARIPRPQPDPERPRFDGSVLDRAAGDPQLTRALALARER